MKKLIILTLLCTLLVAVTTRASVTLNSTNFPDVSFRSYISELTKVAVGSAIPDNKIEAITTIDVRGKQISNLKGIEHFTCIKVLNCGNNQLTTLDLTKNVALEEIWCHKNNLTSINITKNTALKYLYCFENSLSTINVTQNTKLLELKCYDNSITSIDVSKNTSLDHLSMDNNTLNNIDVSKNIYLTELSLGYNKLLSLDVSANIHLKTLFVQNNQLISLDVSKNTKLEKLNCNNNSLQQLDLSKNTNLEFFNFFINQLSYLDLKPTRVGYNMANTWSKCNNQVSTRRFFVKSRNGKVDDCWALYVGISRSTQIRNLEIDGVYTNAILLGNDPGWIMVSDDLKKIPKKVTYNLYTNVQSSVFDGYMDVTVNYDIRSYGVSIDGTKLTSLNFYDIPGLKSGTAYMFDEGEGIGWAGRPTLVLNNAIIEGKKGLQNSDCNDFKIVASNSTIKATEGNAFESSPSKSTTIKGGDTLSFIATGNMYDGMYLYGSYLTITDGSTVICKGDRYGYYDNGGRLYLEEGATLMSYGEKSPSVELPRTNDQHFHSGIGVRYPEKAYINGNHVYYGNTATDVKREWVVLGPSWAKLPFTIYNLYVAGTRVTKENKTDVLGDGKVSYDPKTNVLKLKGRPWMPDNSLWDVKLSAKGDAALSVARVVTKWLGMSLSEARSLVNSAPCVVKEQLPKERATLFGQALEQAGATVKLVHANSSAEEDVEDAFVELAAEGDGIYSNVDDLTIEVSGDYAVYGTNAGIHVDKNTVLKGDGAKLLLEGGNDGLLIGADASVFIEDGLQLTSVGRTEWGIHGESKASCGLYVSDASTRVQAYGGVGGFSFLQLNDGLKVTEPQKHNFYNGNVADSFGDAVYIVTISTPYDPADVNRDGTVDSADIVAVIKEMPDGDKKADVNGDTVIDSADIVAVIKAMK